MERISVVVYASHSSVGAALMNRLNESAVSDVLELVTEISELDAVVRDHEPDVVLADLGLEPALVLETFGKLRTPRPQLIVAGPQDDSHLILSSMRAGAREYISPGTDDATLDAVLEQLATEIAGEGAQTPAPILAVLGAKGGVGTTFVASQLAGELQASGDQSAIVDLCLPIGDVALHLDIHPSFTLSNLASEGARIDATSLRSILQPHDTGLQVLPAPTAIDQGSAIRPNHIERVLQVLRFEVRWVVVDLPRSWSDGTVAALDQADQILLVTRNDVVALGHTRSYLELLDRLGFGDKVKLVLNFDSRRNPLGESDCEEFLTRAPDFKLPEDPAALDAVSSGELLAAVAPRGPLRKAVRSLASSSKQWCGVQESTRSSGFANRIRGLFGGNRHGTA